MIPSQSIIVLYRKGESHGHNYWQVYSASPAGSHPGNRQKQIKEAKKTAEAFASVAREIAEKSLIPSLSSAPTHNFFRDYFLSRINPESAAICLNSAKKKYFIGF